MTAQLTQFAMDCPLPAIRPDSYVERITPGLWCLRTPSCWEGTANYPIKMEEGEPSELTEDLMHVGQIKLHYKNDDPSQPIRKITIEGPIIDAAWWENLAAQDQLGGLDLSKWGIEVKNPIPENYNASPLLYSEWKSKATRHKVCVIWHEARGSEWPSDIDRISFVWELDGNTGQVYSDTFQQFKTMFERIEE